MVESSITVKELVPIVVAAAIWGKSWAGGTVLAKCDNAAVVAMINKGNCKEQECMHLLRCLSFIGVEFNFNLVATHVEGRENVLADALSRNNISLFCQLYPQAHATPTRIPPELLDLLVLSKPNWTSAAQHQPCVRRTGTVGVPKREREENQHPSRSPHNVSSLNYRNDERTLLDRGKNSAPQLCPV